MKAYDYNVDYDLYKVYSIFWNKMMPFVEFCLRGWNILWWISLHFLAFYALHNMVHFLISIFHYSFHRQMSQIWITTISRTTMHSTAIIIPLNSQIDIKRQTKVWGACLHCNHKPTEKGLSLSLCVPIETKKHWMGNWSIICRQYLLTYARRYVTVTVARCQSCAIFFFYYIFHFLFRLVHFFL